MSVLPRKRLVIQAMTGAAVFLVVLAGCAREPTEIGWPDGTPPPPPVPAAAQTSAAFDPAEAEVAEEILTLVHEYREVEVASYADPQLPHLARQDLSGYLADPLLSRILDRIYSMHQSGAVFQGRPKWEPTVVELRLDETPPTATIRDCVDASDWHLVFDDTGDPVPGDELPDQYVERLQVKLYPDGWLLYGGGIEETQC